MHSATASPTLPADHDDDAPDLPAAEAKVRRERPPRKAPKIKVTIRLSPEVIEYFKAGGPGWQSRIDEVLRKAAGV